MKNALVLTSFLMLWSTAALAVPVGTTPDTRPAAPQQRKQWEQQGVTLEMSGSLLQGNINLLNLNSSASYHLNLNPHSFFIDFGHLLTQTPDKNLAHRLNGSALYAYSLTRHWNLYAYSTHSFDESIKLNYRLTNGGGICLHQLFPDIFSLGLLSAGLATENEWFQSGQTPFAVRAVLRGSFNIPLTEWATLGLDGFYTPAVSNFGDYRLYGESYLKFALSEMLSFKISVADEFDSRPQEGVQNNDFGIFTTVSLNLGK